MEIMRVSAKTDVKKLAGALATIIKESRNVKIQVIGAGALKQAIKAIVVARGMLIPVGIDIVMIPSFRMSISEGKEITTIEIDLSLR